jgi:uncharacterized protein (DUF433 family)
VWPPYAGRIVTNPTVAAEKPVIEGARLSAELVLGHQAPGPDVGELSTPYSPPTIDGVMACVAYAGALIEAVPRHRIPNAPGPRNLPNG